MAAQWLKPASLFNVNAHTRAGAKGLLVLFAALVLAVPGAQAQTFNVIYSFQHGAVGIFPYAGVTLDAHGNIYGTNNVSGLGYGSVYKLTYRNGSYIASALYDFQGGNDGAFPASRVVFGPDGNLYGTTSEGGGSGCSSHGCGTVFKLSPPPTTCRASQCSWNETVLYRFTGGADGAIPEFGDIIFDSAGAIYGTTSGNNVSFGSVYKLAKSGGVWTETTLWTFTGGADGFFPMGSVVFDGAGNLYGTMNTGVFELSPSGNGWTETVIHTFDYHIEGLSSESSMVFDNAGNLYSSTFTLGPNEDGSIFEMTPSGGIWNLQVIYPVGHTIGTSLNFDAAGNLYGVCIANRSDNGEAFKMSLVNGSWIYTSLHEFTGGDEGATPYEGMVMDANGNLYGTASAGGDYNLGMVYKITP
jgi:uncharacterized repeat protein (TIGR03803 family)